MIFHFPASVSAAAVADFHTLRANPSGAMPRARRRAAARAAWGVVEREAGESWVGFWQACQSAAV